MREALEVARDGARTPHEMERKNGRLTVCAYVLITARRFLNNYGCMTLNEFVTLTHWAVIVY